MDRSDQLLLLTQDREMVEESFLSSLGPVVVNAYILCRRCNPGSSTHKLFSVAVTVEGWLEHSIGTLTASLSPTIGTVHRKALSGVCAS